MSGIIFLAGRGPLLPSIEQVVTITLPRAYLRRPNPTGRAFQKIRGVALATIRPLLRLPTASDVESRQRRVTYPAIVKEHGIVTCLLLLFAATTLSPSLRSSRSLLRATSFLLHRYLNLWAATTARGDGEENDLRIDVDVSSSTEAKMRR